MEMNILGDTADPMKFPIPNEICWRKQRTRSKMPFGKLTVLVISFSTSCRSAFFSMVVLRNVFFNLNSATKVLTGN